MPSDDKVRALVLAIYDLLVEGSVCPPGFQEAKYRKTATYLNAEQAAEVLIGTMEDGLGRRGTLTCRPKAR